MNKVKNTSWALLAVSIFTSGLLSCSAALLDPLPELPDIAEKSDVSHAKGFQFELTSVDRKVLTDVPKQKLEKDKRFLLGIQDHIALTRSAQSLKRSHQNAMVQHWQKRNYHGLEEVMTIYRESMDPYLQGGTAVLPLYYGTLAEEAIEQNLPDSEVVAQINEWQRLYPKSIAPHLVLGRYYLGKALRLQGDTPMKSLPPERADAVQDYLAKTDEVCEGIQNAGLEVDSYFYSLELELRLALAESNSSLWNIFQQGTQADPAYFPLYERMSRILVPSGRGERDDLSTYALWTITHPAKKLYNKEMLYAQIAEAALGGSLPHPESFMGYRFSWPHIKAGYVEMAQEGHMTTLRLNVFCWMAVHYKDAATSKVLFDALQENREPALWTPEAYQQARTWAASTASK